MSMQNFQVLKSLGEGAFSTVFKVKRISDGQEYALKKVKMGKLTEKERNNALNEVRILASIQHPNIISYKESFMEERTSTLCIVMEHADGGDLLQKITLARSGKQPKIAEQTVWSYFIQMLHGLQALHDRQIVHRDIKCANLFLTKEGVLKLGDLNVSKVAKRGLLQTQTGTPYYASPEVWQDKPYDHKSDIWSMGCVLYEMCALQPPFRANDMNQLFKRVCEGRIPPLPPQYSKDLMFMIKLCLQLEPKLRPSCENMLGRQQLKKNTPSQLSLNMANNNEDLKLIGTIRVPRNLGQITDRLPAANYDPDGQSRLNRQSSLPAMRPSGLAQQQAALPIPGSAISSKHRGGSLAPIKEREEAVRSADPNVSKSRAMAAAAQQMIAVKNKPSGYNGGNAQARQPRRVGNPRSNVDVGLHRSPVIPAGKENLQLPPIEQTGRPRNGAGSVSRQDAYLRNNGAHIMGGQCASARNLHSYRSGSRNGSDGVRDSINMGANKYGGGLPPTASYNQNGTGARPYIKGACYNVDMQGQNKIMNHGLHNSYEEKTSALGGKMGGAAGHNPSSGYQNPQGMAGRPPRPEMFMGGTPASNYQQQYGAQYGRHQGRY